jgi:hypothetical protein
VPHKLKTCFGFVSPNNPARSKRAAAIKGNCQLFWQIGSMGNLDAMFGSKAVVPSRTQQWVSYCFAFKPTLHKIIADMKVGALEPLLCVRNHMSKILFLLLENRMLIEPIDQAAAINSILGP